ncbi:MAG: molybdopterin biosynthesis MoeA, partial [Conexibacter sp.]|nr:molybdopterin biosynthesis MoeA [Conexibacter sp.]
MSARPASRSAFEARPHAARTAELLGMEDAWALVAAQVRALEPEAVPLADAGGRVLAEPGRAVIDLPPFDRSAMDGFAVRAADLAGVSGDEPVALRIVGESRAGRPATTAVSGGEAMAISTGAMIPAGADAIVRVEQTRQSNG